MALNALDLWVFYENIWENVKKMCIVENCFFATKKMLELQISFSAQ